MPLCDAYGNCDSHCHSNDDAEANAHSKAASNSRAEMIGVGGARLPRISSG